MWRGAFEKGRKPSSTFYHILKVCRIVSAITYVLKKNKAFYNSKQSLKENSPSTNPAFNSHPIWLKTREREKKKRKQKLLFRPGERLHREILPPCSLPTHAQGRKVPGCRESLAVVAVIEKKETPLAPIYSHKTKHDFIDIKSIYIEENKSPRVPLVSRHPPNAGFEGSNL